MRLTKAQRIDIFPCFTNAAHHRMLIHSYNKQNGRYGLHTWDVLSTDVFTIVTF